MRQIREEDHAVVMVDDGQVVAEVGYKSIDDHSLVIDHTFVSEQLRGQKIGKELIDKVVNMARDQHKSVIPACSYALALFKRHKEYSDVWQQ
ncbi:GNAT family N-acetyltransferase [Paenibacillus sp. 1-18]|uniref:GNAT family N-acetyltransferase n=1 Tax=Paenibacillus sp. 1-18 TaxID=1333846 RepID=UPI00047071C9|nr:GNAT family N-acetyltransferase [Paenibacillus sp. 1-18]